MFLELFADLPAQIRVKYNRLVGHTFGVQLSDHALRAFKLRAAFTSCVRFTRGGLGELTARPGAAQNVRNVGP